MRELTINEIQQVSGGSGVVLSAKSVDFFDIENPDDSLGGVIDDPWGPYQLGGDADDQESDATSCSDPRNSDTSSSSSDSRSCTDAVLWGAYIGMASVAAGTGTAAIFGAVIQPGAAVGLLVGGAATGAFHTYHSDPSCNTDNNIEND